MVSRQRKDSNKRTLVYQYGAVPIGSFPEEGLDELWRTNHLWNQLVELHNKNRQSYESARRAASDAYALVSESIALKKAEIDQAFKDKRSARMQAGTKDADHPLIVTANAVIDTLIAERKTLYDQAKPLRKQADEGLDKKALADQFQEAVKTARRVQQSGISSVLADQVVAYFQTAREKAFKDAATLRFHRFDGSGYFFYRFRRPGSTSDGVSFNELFSDDPNNSDAFVFLSRDDSRPKKPRLRLRVKVAGGQTKASKRYANFDLILHRPLPKDAQIQNAKLNRVRTGDKFDYRVSFTVKEEMPQAPQLQAGAIGVDIGFRQTTSSLLRAAAIAFVDAKAQPLGDVRFIDVDPALLSRVGDQGHVNALKAQLDDAAAALGRDIVPLLKAGAVLPEDHPKYKMVKAAANLPPNVTLSYERAYKLSTWSHFEPDALPLAVVNALAHWRTTYKHRYRELHNLRAKALLQRKHSYRQIAAELVRYRLPIGIELIDLSKFAETKDADNKLGNTARANRFTVSPSELLNAIKNAGEREGVPVYEVPPRDTSKRCHHCGHVHRALRAEQMWTCPNCATQHDRDHNAAINIARLALEKNSTLTSESA
jgi:transposase